MNGVLPSASSAKSYEYPSQMYYAGRQWIQPKLGIGRSNLNKGGGETQMIVCKYQGKTMGINSVPAGAWGRGYQMY